MTSRTKDTQEKPKRFEGGRISGGCSLHDEAKPDLCRGGHPGHWRTVDCEGYAGSGRDIIECARCGEQRNVSCNFEDDFS